jgi:hypothetical protein
MSTLEIMDDREARPEGDPAIEAAKTLARWLDERYLDPILGFVLPGVGDLLSSLLGVYPTILAWRRGAGKPLVARMCLNLAVDAIGGSVPLVGDVWDVFFKAHSRNLALLEARAKDGSIASRASDTAVVVAAALAVVAAIAAPVAMIVMIVKWLSR